MNELKRKFSYWEAKEKTPSKPIEKFCRGKMSYDEVIEDIYETFVFATSELVLQSRKLKEMIEEGISKEDALNIERALVVGKKLFKFNVSSWKTLDSLNEGNINLMKQLKLKTQISGVAAQIMQVLYLNEVVVNPAPMETTKDVAAFFFPAYSNDKCISSANKENTRRHKDELNGIPELYIPKSVDELAEVLKACHVLAKDLLHTWRNPKDEITHVCADGWIREKDGTPLEFIPTRGETPREFLMRKGIDLDTYEAVADMDSKELFTKYYFEPVYDRNCEKALKVFPLTNEEKLRVENGRQDFIKIFKTDKKSEALWIGKGMKMECITPDYIIPPMYRWDGYTVDGEDPYAGMPADTGYFDILDNI